MTDSATLSPTALLAHAQSRGIALRAEDGRLRFQAPPGALDDSLRAALAASRDELLRLVADAAPPPTPPLAPADPALRDRPSFGQQRLWFLERLHPGTCAYHIPAAFHLEGPLDREALRGAFEALLARHEALRATFAGTASGVRVITAPPARFEMPYDDLAGRPDRAERAEQLRLEEARRPFDLGRGPLLRARLIRLAPDRHTLLVTTHHIASDGWSFGVMTGDLAASYAALLAHEPPALEPLEIQYPDYAAWQQEWMRGPALERDLAFWQQRLAGPLPVVSLPEDYPRPAVQTFHGANRSRRLAPASEQALRALARSERCSLFMVLFTAYAALLQRYSGEDDIVVGTPIANRLRRETEALIGFFVNTLALRVDLSGGLSFREALARVREVALDAFAHQDAPFEKVAERLQPERSLQHTPFFQVMFVHQNAPVPPLALPGLAPAAVDFRGGTSKFDCTLFVEESAGLRCIAEYNTDLFEEATIDALLANYERLLTAAAANPDRPLAELDLVGERERDRLVALGTGAPLAPETLAELGAPVDSLSLTALLDRQRGLTPDAPAVTAEGVTWSYRELHAAADRVAAALRERGIGREDIVPILAERSLEMMAGLLGTLKAGAAYLPLDPDYPPARLAFMLEDAAARLILTQRHLAGRLPGTSALVLCLDEPADLEASAPPPANVRPEDACYLIYTSGSTGQPKGVIVEHRSVVNRLLWQWQTFPLAPGEAVLQKTPYTFDVSVAELFWPLTVGGRLVMARPGGHRDPEYLATVIRDERVASCHFVPSMLRAFLAAVPPARLAMCRDLRLVPASGEALTPDLVAAFYGAMAQAGLPHVRLHNLYGPTEATVEVTHWPCPPAGADYEPLPRSIPIGRPLANVRCYVLDERQRPTPAGVWGELCLAGVQTARGYLNRPELTADRFVPDPFFPGDRMYRTGDVVRWDASGAIEYRGRADGQVKLRGFRIETGEIEAALRAVPGVRDATVVMRTEDAGGPRLAAYVTPLDAPDAPALRAALAATLPDYMLPASITPLAVLPLTPSGKVDRRALPAPPAPAAASAAEPATDFERIVAEAWAESLGLPRVGIDDNYFDLGGHSLLAIGLHARLRERLQREIPLVDLFAYPTVRGFAAHLAAEGARPDDDLRAVAARAAHQRLARQRGARRP